MKAGIHIKRFLSNILPTSDTKRIVVVTGARQTGKTTLSRRLYRELNYINLDSPENREILRRVSTAGWTATVGNAVIDEAQKEPSVFEKVKYAYDEGNISFTVLTGSSQILLLKKIRESLAGRAFFYELWPLMQCELHRQGDAAQPAAPLFDSLLSGRPVGEILKTVPAILLDDQDHRYRVAEDHILQWGGMPALLPLSTPDRWQWLKNYSYTYLERDVEDLARLDDLLPFRKFQRATALRSARLLNYSELARDTGVGVDTARRYLEYLRISYQAVLLQPYYRNLTSSLVKTPKLYWTDVGILRQITGFKGAVTGELYETMVVGEMTKWVRTRLREAPMYFYRTRSGMEVDLLIETSDGLIGVEVKSRETVSTRDVRAMKDVAGRLGKRWRGGLVVYTGKEIAQIDEPDIWSVPSRRLFQPPTLPP